VRILLRRRSSAGAYLTMLPASVRARPGPPERSKLALVIFWGSAAFLAPWIVFLFIEQAKTGTAHHLRWVNEGIALCLLAGMIVTAILAARRSQQVLLSAAFCGTLAFITAWFGTVSAHGAAFWFLLFHAIFVLLPVCVLSFWVVSVTYDHRGGDPGLPSWVPAAYLVGALIIVPLIVVGFIAVHPDRAVVHLRLLWTGLDCFELAMMIATGVLVWRRSSALAVTAMCLGTLMFADAWFNIFATTGAAAIAAIVMACGELPLSVYAVYAAHHEVHRWSRV
jgi:hypothetical protein